MSYFAFICVIGTFTSCQDDIALNSLPYLFRPINFSYSLNKTIATLSWAAVDSAKSYTLQIATDSTFKSLVVDTTISKLSFSKELAGETVFYAQVRTNATDPKKNSFFNKKFSNGDLFFTTPKENLFQGYGTKNNTGNVYSAYMNDVNTLDIMWSPRANVSHLILHSADGATRDSVVISSAEALAGEKVIGSLANSTWKVEIFNNKILRGTTSGVIEGDIIVASGQSVIDAMNLATPGQIILLASGAAYPMGTGTYRLSKNIKLRGLSVTNRSILHMSTGSTTTSSMLGFVDASDMTSVKFENIDFSGYIDNISGTGGTKIGYLFNNNTATHVAALTFNNCNLHNFGNTPMRLQANKKQSIDTLRFNGCTINDIGFSSTYAIVNSNSDDHVLNVFFNNCTVYNFKGSLVLRTGAYTMGIISVTNCSINQGMQDPGSARYLIDTSNTTVTNGINIKNCIFGITGNTLGANGVRNTNTSNVVISPLTVTGSYFTTDYVDDAIPPGTNSYSIKSKMSSYPGTSSGLWNDPVNGDFKLKDTGFTGKGLAGDLRWY